MKLEGQFVNLDIITPDHAEVTFAWRQSNRANLLNQGAKDVAQQKKWIESRPNSEYNFIIKLKKDSKPVGMISLIKIDFISRNAESARFLIGDEESVKGVPAAVEAMKLLYALAFEQLKLHRIYGIVVSDNKLMLKWQKYLGMQEEGILRKHYFIGGEFRDGICLGLLKDEYHKISLPRMETLISVANRKQ